MTLTEQNMERIKKAAGKVGCWGKVVLLIQDGLLFSITTENNERVYNDPGESPVKLPNNSRGGRAG